MTPDLNDYDRKIRYQLKKLNLLMDHEIDRALKQARYWYNKDHTVSLFENPTSILGNPIPKEHWD